MFEAGALAGDLAQLPVADTLGVEVTALAVHQGHHGQGHQQPGAHVCQGHDTLAILHGTQSYTRSPWAKCRQDGSSSLTINNSCEKLDL